MIRRTSITMGVALVAALGLGLVGCGDDDGGSNPPDGGGSDGMVMNDGGGGSDGAVNGDGAVGDGGLTCEQQVIDAQPSTSMECATCLCDNCMDEADTCNASSSCTDNVACAQGKIEDCTCAGDISGATCITTECGFALTDPAAALLLCINNNCSAECTPMPMCM